MFASLQCMSKYIFSKPSRKIIVASNFCFLELEASNFGYFLIFFNSNKLCKVCARLNKLDISHSIKNLNFGWINRINKNQPFASSWCKQDSKELSPRSLDKMLLKWQVKMFKALNCLNSSNSVKSSKFSQIFYMIFKHV